MRQIECDLASCGQVTYLVDETYTLDQGWASGTDSSTAPFYVCPDHAGLGGTPMLAAVITKPPEAGDEPDPIVPAAGDRTGPCDGSSGEPGA